MNTKEIGVIGKITITDKLQKIIDRLHREVGSTEWSGMLFYKLKSGNIADFKNLEFESEFLYPMNIGSSVYTEFEYTGEIMKAYDLYQDGIESSCGLIHSH